MNLQSNFEVFIKKIYIFSVKINALAHPPPVNLFKAPPVFSGILWIALQHIIIFSIHLSVFQARVEVRS